MGPTENNSRQRQEGNQNPQVMLVRDRGLSSSLDSDVLRHSFPVVTR